MCCRQLKRSVRLTCYFQCFLTLELSAPHRHYRHLPPAVSAEQQPKVTSESINNTLTSRVFRLQRSLGFNAYMLMTTRHVQTGSAQGAIDNGPGKSMLSTRPFNLHLTRETSHSTNTVGKGTTSRTSGSELQAHRATRHIMVVRR